MLPIIISHTPAGTSTQNIVHFAQEVDHGNKIHALTFVKIIKSR